MGNVIVKKLSEQEKQKMGVYDWPIWEKEVSHFDWYYDSDEDCQILDGEVVVKTDEGDFIIKTGDFVTFKKGLKCEWDVKRPIKKHYKFR